LLTTLPPNVVVVGAVGVKKGGKAACWSGVGIIIISPVLPVVVAALLLLLVVDAASLALSSLRSSSRGRDRFCKLGVK